MLRWVQTLFWCFGRWALGLRYQVHVVGLEKLGSVTGPTLVMPNHPGYIDPPLVQSHVRLKQPLRPVVTASMYRNPLLYPFMRLVQALEVPELAEQSRGSRNRTLAMIDTVVAGLQRGETFLIYPSGRAQQRGVEVVGAARSVSEILDRFPQANLVLVRTRGVWGSMFSYAQTGKPPRLGRCLLSGLGWIIANLVFFAPRRKVTMTIEVVDHKNLPGETNLSGTTRDKLNRYLEDWYNLEGPESPVYVPYHPFFGPRVFHFPDIDATDEPDLNKIRPATIKAVNEILEEYLKHPLADDEKQPQTSLDQIGLDSLDRMDIAWKLEDRFGFHSDRLANTLGELWALAEGLTSSTNQTAVPAPAAWERSSCAEGPGEVLAETVVEAFVRRALLHPNDVAAADEVSGVLTYRQMLVGARLMGRSFAKLPGDAIGVLLPASVAADVTFLGLHLAGKLPAMLNWTTGPANLTHAVQKLSIRCVVTSRKFIDRLSIEVAGADYIFLEDLRTQIGKFSALRAMLASYVLPRAFLRDLPKPAVDDPAVVLFTSGSESTPKIVPLSHGNLISTIRAAMAVLLVTNHDRLLGCLPPFHSFGLLGNIVGPLLTGVRVVHYPDPTNASGLVQVAGRYQVTILVTTPTFLSNMLRGATAQDLRQVRIVVTGAEKCCRRSVSPSRRIGPQRHDSRGLWQLRSVLRSCRPIGSIGSNRGSVGLPVARCGDMRRGPGVETTATA